MLTEARQRIADLPGIVWLRRQRYIHALKRGAGRGQFWGAFSSHDEAVEGARHHPSRLVVGYNTSGVARAGRDNYERMFLHDYPAAAWLSHFACDNSLAAQPTSFTIVDLGGHFGEKYHLFRRLWSPQTLPKWVVLETPSAVEIASGPSGANPSPLLSFSSDRGVLDGASILFASGSLQYLERDLWHILDDLTHPPSHIVLNKVPLSAGREFWTTQNADGQAIVTYHVWNRDRFLNEMKARGYMVVDEWLVPDRWVTIPFERHLGTTANSGLCLTRSRG